MRSGEQTQGIDLHLLALERTSSLPTVSTFEARVEGGMCRIEGDDSRENIQSKLLQNGEKRKRNSLISFSL